ncbi:hypothetical protein Tco_0662741 [Tanacetum coccineum]
MCRLLGLTYREAPPILIEKVKVTRYTIGPEETYIKVKVLGIDKMPRTRDNVATIRDGLIEEMGVDGSSNSKEIEFEVTSTRIHVVNMDDPNITMEKYIRLEEEKARRRGKVYNWETAKYGKIWYAEDVHDLRSVETEFLAIVFNDKLTSEGALSCEPTVSPLNDNELDFRISFDESDDEDYTIIFEKNSFSYKIIFVNDLKTDSKNDNEKVNMPSFSSPEPTVSYFDDIESFKDFENEFSAIVYNDALTSKSDFLPFAKKILF